MAKKTKMERTLRKDGRAASQSKSDAKKAQREMERMIQERKKAGQAPAPSRVRKAAL